MPGRTENNVKNRFNMMFKNIKDQFIKNRNHSSIKVLDVQDPMLEEDGIDEEKLILQLIEKKKKERELKQQSEQNTSIRDDAKTSDNANQILNRSISQTNRCDNSDQGSNMNIDNSSRISIRDDRSSNNHGANQEWIKQKEFLKLTNICQNKEKINHAIEKLIEACPNQLNIIKRLVEYIQDDINRIIRQSTAFASNTSIGSTNNLLNTPGGGRFKNSRFTK
jgi:hypothetical protein